MPAKSATSKIEAGPAPQRVRKPGALKRVPHCSETCASCADMQRMIGDRDEQIRQLHRRATAGDRAVQLLAEVVAELDQAEVPTLTGKAHESYTVAGRVRLGLKGRSRQ